MKLISIKYKFLLVPHSKHTASILQNKPVKLFIERIMQYSSWVKYKAIGIETGVMYSNCCVLGFSG
jgi:Na+-translocating ferredoxin:NAD+ oxidoreductase RnfA subunit